MPAFKKIKDYSPLELNTAVDTAVDYCASNSLDFFKILNGVDAYFERRRRKEETLEAAKTKSDDDFFGHKD